MKRSFYLLAVVALLLSACASEDKPTTPSASVTPVPTATVADCVTAAGSQTPAAPKGVDYKTQLKEQGVLNIGSDNAFPPFENIEAGQSEPVGFDVDLYKEVAKELGLTAKSTTTSFDGLFTQSVPRGQFDLGISAITIKESRKQTVDFTDPYFEANLSLAVNTQKTPNIKTIDDLAGVTIGVQTGTTGADCADALVKQNKAKEVKKFDTAVQAFDDLVAGGVGAVINDRPASEGIIEQRSALAVVQVLETNEKYGFAISKDKPDLRVAVNNALKKIMDDGRYATIYEKWFGTKPPFDVPIG
jgi:ABC-type amino acid transport substrate-binding protein